MHYQRFGQIRHMATCGEVVPVVCEIGARGCHVGGTGGKSKNTAPGKARLLYTGYICTLGANLGAQARVHRCQGLFSGPKQPKAAPGPCFAHHWHHLATCRRTPNLAKPLAMHFG